jgi:hypothetical protein
VRATGEKTAREPEWSFTGRLLENRRRMRRGERMGKWVQTDCCSATEFYAAETQEGDGESGYVGRNVADNHYIFRVRGNEFRGHDCVMS